MTHDANAGILCDTKQVIGESEGARSDIERCAGRCSTQGLFAKFSCKCLKCSLSLVSRLSWLLFKCVSLIALSSFNSFLSCCFLFLNFLSYLLLIPRFIF